MTRAWRSGKARGRLGLLFGLVLAIAAAGLAAAGEREPVVVDPNSGLAISGIDPVAYFTDKNPVFGRPALELSLDGTIWRFRNEGNRAAFAAHPEVYRPRFGGYDPTAIARDRSVAGNPLIWAIVEERLYLFYSDETRRAFLADPQGFDDRATRKWPVVARTAGR